MATFDTLRFRKKVLEKLENSSTRRAALNLAQDRFDEAKEEMIAEFDAHKITLELEDGPDADNSSGTLGGKGNLFSFIGFDEDENPTEVVRDYLEVSTQLRKTPVFDKRTSIFTFRVAIPTMEGVEKQTPFPWEPRSWARGIESGISGLGNYIFFKLTKEKGRISKSRSGTALQSEERDTGLVYKATKYLSEIIRNFRKKL